MEARRSLALAARNGFAREPRLCVTVGYSRLSPAMISLRTILLVGLWLAAMQIAPLLAGTELDHTKPATEPIALTRGTFEIAWYQPTQVAVRGLFVFGSGDGGWSYWESRMARHLAKRGWAVAGIDFALYAATDFNQEILAADFARLVNELSRRSAVTANTPDNAQPRLLPVIYGGWSMGAEHSLPAAAALSARPAALHGLLLVAPGPRGRYGLRTSDKLGITPTGEGTFGLADFAPQLNGLRLAQLHAGLDPLDSIDWFKGLQLDLRLWKFPRAFHDFSNANDKFLALTDKAIDWLLANPALKNKRS